MEHLASTFRSAVGVEPEASRLNTLILDAYEDRLSDVRTDEFAAFLRDRPYIAKHIAERAPNHLLFRQPAVLLIYYLAQAAPRETRRQWPLTPSELQLIYEDLGQRFEA